MTNSGNKKIIRPAEVEKMFGDKLSKFIKDKVLEFNIAYSELTTAERDACIKKIVEFLISKFVVYSGKHRFNDWERGWGENLKKWSGEQNLDFASPGYFGKYPIFRINQTWVRAESKDFERDSLSLIVNWLADKYFRNVAAIYEFGCGTGHHLPNIRKINPEADITGLDWVSSSQKVIKKIALTTNDKKLYAHRFDFFNPEQKFKLKENSAVYTVAALEQTGVNYKKFVDYLIKNKPEIVVNIEPIAELLDENNLLDYLSVQYFKKRKYLDGFLNHLRFLEKQGKIEILRAQRTFIGSLFIDGYSVVAWKPTRVGKKTNK